ncbi:beta-galactosidase [Oceanomicrobium pacificus]|uniref:Beta-galactosidase n=1 Tax=Oceanomicrobium pacificus TaxID=2692916 RepID=A0A6B0TI57_9RHOB|nr:beta-galactosidase [Oceanomicrobium pacificus]MXU64100.1 beta-galactosidase [Oceanomicrobium pacificus]
MKRALGVCYYPEHWPEEIWAEDAVRMAETGLTWVRIGEFAWSRMEPVPGTLDLDWLDRAIEILGQAGLKVVMGTPTATPPRWMLERHPDMLALDAEGRPRGFGSRRHYCFSHEGYREESARITRILAERYGQNPHVAAWQTDNEFGCHDTTYSYSDAARAGFRNWLSDRYGQIDNLNKAWGNVFWSMEYRTYGEIDVPNLTVTEPNPAHVLDFKRFSSDQVVAFNRIQTEIIRAHSAAPIIHNFMGRTVEFDHFAVGEDLDIASWDSYPLGFLDLRSDEGDAWKRRYMRQGDPDFQAFHHDLYRATGKGRWWIMEQQPGPVNWAPHNPAPLKGMPRLWAWEAFAHGAETVCYFRWRQAPYAQEQMHAGLLRPDSAPAPALADAAQVARELQDAPEAGCADAPVGLVFDYEAAWAWATQPQSIEFDYFRLVFETYRALRRAGLSVDILPPDVADLSAYKMVAAPGMLHWRPAFLDALATFEGQALLGPRTGSKTAEMSIPVPLPPALPGIDVTVSRVESLRPDAPVALADGGAFRFWREELEGTAEVVERAEDGLPALMRSGNLWYCGGWADPDAMRRIVGRVTDAAGLQTLDLPEGLRIRDSGGRRYLFNYEASTQSLSGIAGLDGFGTEIAPAGVAWTDL